MLKVLKYLKKSYIAVISIILLLCLQATSDLTLPDYTSKIVNVGIQQGGIENNTPEVLRKSTVDNLKLFLEDENYILNNYTLISKTNLNKVDYEKYKNKYPSLENEDLYILNDLSNEEIRALSEKFAKPLITLSSISQEELANIIKEQILLNFSEEQKNVITNMSLLDILKIMPQEQRTTLLEEISKTIDIKLGNMTDQAAIQVIKDEYSKIGLDLNYIQNRYLIITGIKMLGIALISTVAAISIMFLSSKVAAKLGKTLREKVFKKVLSFSTKEFREFSTASLITRNTNDIQQIQQLITMLFRVVVYAPIMGIGGFLRLLAGGNTSMAWIIGLAIFCIIVIILTLFILAMPKFKKLQSLVDKLNLVSREILTGIPVIRAFNTEKREEKRFDDANTDLMKTNIFVNRIMSIMMPALTFVMNAVMLLIIWVGGKNVEQGIIQVGDILAFIQYTMHIVISFLFISMLSIILPRASVSANRINEVLEADLSIKDKENTKTFDEDKKGLVEFKNVSFRYPDADTEILEDITFTAKPGETTAIIGSTGSGKSTIVNLIPRLYDVTGGELLIDGINVKEVSQKELRKKIGFIPQKGVLFSGTIESNIKYGNENISEEKMKEAALIAQATDFIEAKNEKYSSHIAQGGSNVSGGQKQRLSIARAIAIDPDIFVFDDSFSALDLKTDRALREALKEKTENKTVIIVAQRISTILNAEQIIVLDDGKIVGKGTHEKLMNSCETYKQIAMSQLSEEELE
ncbi:MAG: ABC transporter ATP-binding protein [Clostridia bacterium]|nr:ABC transporter ATP-binding protein [Clostridia bacterium]